MAGRAGGPGGPESARSMHDSDLNAEVGARAHRSSHTPALTSMAFQLLRMCHWRCSVDLSCVCDGTKLSDGLSNSSVSWMVLDCCRRPEQRQKAETAGSVQAPCCGGG